MKDWEKAFGDVREIIIEPNHQPNCKFKGRTIPIDACPCDCYEKFVFQLGFELGKKSMEVGG